MWLHQDFVWFSTMTEKKPWMSKPQLRRTEQKFRGKFSLANVFSKLFQVLSRGTWKLSRKWLAELSKPHSMGPEEHVHSNIFEASLNHFNFPGLLLKFPWQQRKINFRVDKNAKNVSRGKVREKFTPKEKSLLIYFSQVVERRLLSFLAKNYRHGCQNCNLCTFQRFWG